MFHKYAFALLAGIVALAPLSGCNTGREGITKVFGTYTTRVSAPADQAIAAAREVFREMSLTEVSYTATVFDGRLIAQSATDKTFEVTTRKAGERMSELSVRVGTGDEKLTYEIIDKIKMKL